MYPLPQTYLHMIISQGQLLVLAALLLMAMYMLIRGRQSQKQISFISILLGLVFWLIGQFLRQFGYDTYSLWLLVSLEYLGLSASSLGMVYLGAVYASESRLPARLLIPVALPIAAAYLLVLTHPLHDYFLSSYERSVSGTGFFFYPVLAINLLYTLIGIWLCCRSLYRRFSGRFLKITLLIMIVGLPVGLYAYLLFQVSLLRLLAPVVLACLMLLSGLAGLQRHEFEVTPLARRLAMNEISSALAITRPDFRLIDVNLAMARLFDPNAETHLLLPISQLSPQFVLPGEDQLPLSREVTFDTTTGQRLFDLNIYPVYRASRQLRGLIYRLVDLDHDQQMRQLLEEQNRQLALANQSLQRYLNMTSELRSIMVRNQMAREMHDSLGHTLIILVALLEKMNDRSDQAELDTDMLKQAIELLNRGKDQLPLPQNRRQMMHEATEAGQLQRAINQMGSQLISTGVRLETEFRGQLDQIPDSHQQDLIQICREAVTNAVKHGQAKTISVFLLVSENRYRLVILDDGCGNPQFDKGFGLQNMEQRVRRLGGTLRLQSDSSGFGIYVTIDFYKAPGYNGDSQDYLIK